MSIDLCVLASGSGGNCTVVRTPAGVVLVDAGLGPRTTYGPAGIVAGSDRQPIDLLYLMQETGDVPLGFLDDRVLNFVHATAAPALGTRITIEATIAGAMD